MIPPLVCRIAVPVLAVPVIAGCLMATALMLVPLTLLEAAKDADPCR